MTTPIKICNAVAVALGAGVIQSLEDDTDLSRIFANSYDLVKHSVMSRYAWRFLTDRRRLSRDGVNPVQGFKYQFIIPGDALQGFPHAVYLYQDQKIGTNEFTVNKSRVQTDYPDIWAELIINRSEDTWPAWFQELIFAALAARVGKAVTDQQNVTDYYHALAFGTPSDGGIGGLMGDAMTLDSQGSGNTGIENDVFVNARRGW